jgi:hypothetical protein
MNSTVKRLTAVAAVATMAIAIPVAGASAATTPAAPPANLAFALPSLPAVPDLPAFTPAPLSFVAPAVGGLSVAIGPTVITVGAGNIFTDTTITTGGGAAFGAG